MDEVIGLPVTFNNSLLSFTGRLLNYGYSYKLELNIERTKVLFEPDEERNWRAAIPYEDLSANKKINRELLQAIAEAIDKIVK